MDGLTINVAPSFATNFRAKLFSAMQPRRLVSFVIAMFCLIYAAVVYPDPHLKNLAITLAIFLVLVRMAVIALTSLVTKSGREALTMRLTFDEEGIDVTRWGMTVREDWDFIRKAFRQQNSLVLELQRTFDFVLVDRNTISADDWIRLDALLARRKKL